jgi:hypothetical protein
MWETFLAGLVTMVAALIIAPLFIKFLIWYIRWLDKWFW